MATQTNLPTRSNTTASGYTSDDDAVPTGDPSSTLGLLEERLQAWKHMTGYLEDYIKAVAKDQHTQSKDSEKILKTLNHPLKEGHHFDQSLGGVAGLFENLRANTQAQSQLHAETEKNLTGSVLPILERLHKEIKSKRKELDSGAGKQSKAVDSSRNSSQKHIELLGQHTATFDSTGGRTTAANDPYVLQRGVLYRLNKQLMEENNHRSDLINIQNNFQHFENSVISTLQGTFQTYNQLMANQYDRSKAMYGDMAMTAGRIDPNFEWNGFLKRNGHILVSPNTPARSVDSLSFPNMGHRATKPLIEGSLERKSRGMGALGSYKTNYVAITPAGFLHVYKDNDNFNADPEPETSLYLPDSVVGAVDGQKFTVKGKDSSGGKLSQKMSMSSEYQFKAHTPADAQMWHGVISSVTSGQSSSVVNSPTSPQTAQQFPPAVNTAVPGQTTGPTSASPLTTQHQPAVGQTASPLAAQQQPIAGHETVQHQAAVPGQQTTGTIPPQAIPQSTGTIPPQGTADSPPVYKQ